MLSEGGCAKGPVPAARLARSGEMSQAAACILFCSQAARAGPGKGLRPSRCLGRGLTCLETSPAACACPARTIPKLASHPVPLTSSLAQHHLQGGLAWAVPTLSPLLASLLRPATAWGRGAEGWGRGVLSACWWLVRGDGQGSASPAH